MVAAYLHGDIDQPFLAQPAFRVILISTASALPDERSGFAREIERIPTSD